MISKKELEILISKLETFQKPKPQLEQYQTPSDLASELLWTAFMDGNIRGKKVSDLGTGTGIFAIGSSLLGSKLVVGYDMDTSAIAIARRNIKLIKQQGGKLGKITFQKSDVAELKKKYDTVIMNPPFGIQTKHADKDFLEKAFSISKKAVYSMHRSGPQVDRFIEAIASDSKFLASKLIDKEFIIKQTMDFHEKEKYPIEVALWRFTAL